MNSFDLTAAASDPGAPYYCWACERHLDAFESYGEPPRAGRCPACGAKPRHRAMLWYLSQVIAPRLKAGARVLEIGAAKFATRHFPSATYIGDASYTAIDLRCLKHHRTLRSPHVFLQGSATQLPFGAEAFDVILCNNTLTYIPDDRRALEQMRNCLRTDGLLMIQTHRHAEPTCTAAAYAAKHPELPTSWFAENGDAWVYGPDFFTRVSAAGLDSRIDVPLQGQQASFYKRFGIKPRIEFIVAFRDAKGAERFSFP